jgi:N-acetylmuramoyl-L-alanine amidase
MQIIDHRLCRDDRKPFPFAESPNKGGRIDARYLVMHYTSGRSAESSVEWFKKPEARASAHLVIGRDGSVTQMVPFNRVAWHAGTSRWEGLTGLNAYAIGIELDNAGRLTRQGERWAAWFGAEYPDEDVLVAAHKNESVACGWHRYTTIQLETAVEAANLIVMTYGLLDVVGHDDIAPFRKSDPGPAFPMASFRSRVVGRREEDEPVYRTTARLNIRTGPGTDHPAIKGSPLPLGTRVDILSESGSWRFVDVEGRVNNVMDLQGWVHGRYLARAR